MKNKLIFLHGFLGSPQDFDEIISLLPSSLKDRFEILSPHLTEIEKVLTDDHSIVIAYSMGARVALNHIIQKKIRLRGLVIESSSLGIKESKERKIRQQSDAALLLPVLEGKQAFSDFLSKWYEQALFKGLSAKAQKTLQEKCKLDPHQQHELLLRFGPGTLPHAWSDFSFLNFPILCMAGENDEKYKILNEQMHKLNPVYTRLKILANCSHNIHLQAPKIFAQEIGHFVASL